MTKSPETWQERLDQMERELTVLEDATFEGRAPVELDQTRVGRLSRMDAMQGQAMNTAISARRRAMKLRIAAARERLNDGEFGYCLTCGDRINEKRLTLDPTTPLCTSCAQQTGR